ncbi:hypothetical protein DY000_02057764 [Brassica cretica]|uniref:NB-ARC domain-containing protein n=1 Tax=Brassica cretica TaxID=69181 RepID=A0ABQ7AF59_BRACR|nr:hypothetical protein DY000_02057764 [Brassica cretica]
MGGVGKTTLLTQINNRFSNRGGGFDVVMWVVVSQNATVHKIQGSIGEKLGLGGIEWDEKSDRVNLSTNGVPYPSKVNGSKVVFTTRSRDVCGRMGVDDPIEVCCLDTDKAWDLFTKKVGENTLGSHQDIPELARKVAGKCRGLPLALNVIGGTMASKRSVQEWRRAVDVLTSSAREFSGVVDEILPILKYSYDNLDGEMTKSCFLYCFLYPEDGLIDKEELIEYWIGEEFIDEKGGRERAINQGYEILETLVRACLLLEERRDLEYVKMHDVVREMAVWIATDLGKNKEKCIVQARAGLREIPKVKNWKDVRRISLTRNDIAVISESPDCPHLTTLLLQYNKLVENYLSGFRMDVCNFVSLRYPNLSHTRIEELPFGIYSLKLLTHLNFEGTRFLKSLDGISGLSSLKTLKLRHSKVLLDMSLMKELQLLQHIEYITVSISPRTLVGEKLFYDPKMGRCIQKVSIYNERGGRRVSKSNSFASFGRSLLHLHRRLWNVGGDKDREDTMEQKPDKSMLLKPHNWRLEEIISKEKAASVLENNIIPFKKLEKLSLMTLPELKSIYWNALPFQCLRYLAIMNDCPKLRKLPLNSESVFDVEKFVIRCEDKEWSERVEWEDEATRLRFLPSCDQVLKDVSCLSCFKASHIKNLEENLAAMQRDMEELKASQTHVLRRVEREEDTGSMQRLAEVKVWLKNVDNISRQVSYLLNSRTAELERLSLSGLCSQNSRSNYGYAERVSLMLKKLNDLKSESVFQVVVEPTTKTVTKEKKKKKKLFRSRPAIVGRKTILKKALSRLVSGGTRNIGLYGVGGVSKSTILREISNKITVGFDIVIWVVV